MTKSYCVLARDEEILTSDSLLFVRDGFSFKAFFFSTLWLFYHKLWLIGLIISAIYATLSIFDELKLIDRETLLIFQFFTASIVGSFANNWLLRSLEVKGYNVVDIVVADDITKAKLRFFDKTIKGSNYV
jgi:uncharacterized protein DUF2628